MFLAGSLYPEYFSSKVNLHVALGPLANMKNVDVPVMQTLAGTWEVAEYLVKVTGTYNILDADWSETYVSQLFCDSLGLSICEGIIGMVADSNPEVDDFDRFDIFLKDYPAGQGYQCLIAYAQNILDEGWRLYDYGRTKNMEKYGAFAPPEVPLNNYSLPTALIAGEYDRLADLLDIAWLKTRIDDHVIFYGEFPLGHLSYALAKDMTWFSDTVMGLIN